MDEIARSITDYYIEKDIIAKDKREIYVYGFKLIMADIFNYILVVVFGAIIGKTAESVLFLIILFGLRRFCGGFHAKTFTVCRLSMIITYISVIILSDIIGNMKRCIYIVLILNFISIVFVAMFAPVEHPNKPLLKKQREENKRKSIIMSVFVCFVSLALVIKDIESGVIMSTTMTAVIILMVVSMLLKKGGKKYA